MHPDMEAPLTSTDFLLTGTGLRVDFFTADEIRALALRPDHSIIEIVDWAENFLAKPSALVGRSGNVCPFIPQAMLKNRLKFSVVFFRNQGLAAVPEIEDLIECSRDYFRAKEKAQIEKDRAKREGSNGQTPVQQKDGGSTEDIDLFGSLVMIFPQITKEQAGTVIDPPQRKYKSTFVKLGLMLGEFHPLSPTPGLRSAAFRPLRSPIPLLAIRHMVESDIDFLISPNDPPEVRVESISAYIYFLGSSLSPASRRKAEAALAKAKAESAAKSTAASII